MDDGFTQPQTIIMQPGAPQMQPVGGQPGVNNVMVVGDQVWVAPPNQPPPLGCPPGLEILASMDQIIIKQQKELLEIVTGWEQKNKYKIMNTQGQSIFFAKEDTSCCNRMWCGPCRQFNMNLFDHANTEVIHFFRPLKCSCCCCPCSLQEIEVQAPVGTPVGRVTQKWSICTPMFSPKYEVCDEQGNAILNIQGPFCLSKCCADIEFQVLALDGITEVGKITKKWMGFVTEAFTDADTFAVSFPMDLDVKVKATMIGAAMLIDYIHFEDNDNNS